MLGQAECRVDKLNPVFSRMFYGILQEESKLHTKQIARSAGAYERDNSKVQNSFFTHL